MREQSDQMRQATTAKVCLDLAKSGRFTVPVLSTAGFNRPLLALSTICLCPSRSKERSWPRNRGKSGECRLNAARCVQEAAQRFQIPQSFRFGAHIGAIAFSKVDGPNLESPSVALVIRAAARIEPYASPGTILCTEEFLVEVDEATRSSFTSVRTPPSGESGLLFTDDGTVVVRKSDEDEPMKTRLFQFSLCRSAQRLTS